MYAKKTLMQLNVFFSKLLRMSLAHSLTVLIIGVVIALFGFGLSLKLVQSVAIQELLEPSMQSTKDLVQMQKDFGSTNILLATFKGVNSSKKLCALEIGLNEVLLATAEVEKFSTPLQARRTVLVNDRLIFERVTPNPCETEFVGLQNLAKSPWGSILTNPQGTDYTLFVNFKQNEVLGPYGFFRPEVIQNAMRDMQGLTSEAVHFTGNAAHDYFSFQGMQQSAWLNIMASLIVLLGIRIFFGTWRAGIFYFLTLGGTMGIVLGGMALFGHPIDLLTGCLFLMIMISTLQDFIFLSHERLDYPDRSLTTIFENLLMPSFLTSLTTFVGFITLTISDLGIIRRFGFWAAMAAILEWVFVFLIFPAFLKQFNIQTWVAKTKSWRPTFGSGALKWAPSKLLTKISVVLVVIPAVFIFQADLTQSPLEMFPADHVFQKALKDQHQEKGWIAQVYVEFSENVLPEKIRTVLAELRNDPAVLQIESWEQDVAYVLQPLNNPYVHNSLKKQLEVSSLGENFISATGKHRAFIFLKTAETKILNKLSAKTKTLCPLNQCQLVGEYIAFASFSTELIRTLFESLFLSLLLVGMIILFICKAFSVKPWFKLLLSIAWGPLFILGILMVTGGNINVVTCIVASILVGLAGDNAIQYIYAGQGLSETGVDLRSSASVITAIVMTVLSCVFLFSYFQPPRDLGGLMALGFLANLAGDVWLLKGLLKTT